MGVAIVTGGDSGVGDAAVVALAGQGANIVVHHVANPAATDGLEQQGVGLGDRGLGVWERRMSSDG